MANHTGKDGVVKVGSNTVAETRSWSLSEEAETIENTAMGDAARTFEVGLKTWSVNVSAFWDETDTNGQVAMAAGSSITLNLYPEGAGAGDTYYSGTALITSTEKSAELDGMVEISFDATGSGALSTATV